MDSLSHSASSYTPSHRFRTVRFVLNLVKLNKCDGVCVSVVQRRRSGDGCLSTAILYGYKYKMGHLFI